jgi:myo-inositol-1(or 4)-monophosphatase
VSVVELDTLCDIAREAGALLLSYYHKGVSIREKEGEASYNLVSDADVEAEKLIISRIKELYPDHSFLAEESDRADANSENLWVIDPLDGTNNFAHHMQHFAVSIAYYQNGEAQKGVVFNPVSGELFGASAGEGAFLNGEQIRVSQANSLDKSLIGTGFYYDRGFMMEQTLEALRRLFCCNIHGIRRLGTASLDLCYVACGRYEGYFEFQLSAWDYAAGQLILTEAGGQVTNCLGENVSLGSTSMLASNGALHCKILEQIAPCWERVVEKRQGCKD